jgi:signal transduction histidine kinase/HAMP domain-containing protein
MSAKRHHLSDTAMIRALDPNIGLSVWQRFQSRLLAYLLGLSCLSSMVAGAIYYSRQVKFVEAEQSIRGNTLISNLAGQSELGAYSSDSAFLAAPLRRAFLERDVSFAAIYNRKGELLIQLVKSEVKVDLGLDPQILRLLLADVSGRPLRQLQPDYEDLFASIVTIQGDAEEGLFGAASVTHSATTIGVARLGLSHKPAQKKLDEILRWGIYLSLIILAFGALFALVLAHRISLPILALARGADEIRRGNLGYQLHLKRADELGLLAESFNRMSSKLKQTVDSLAHLNRNLEGEVGRRTAALCQSRDFISLLNAPLQLTKLLDTALDALMRFLGARAGCVFLHTGNGEFELVVVQGADEKTFLQTSNFQDQSLLQETARLRHSLVLRHFSADHPLIRACPTVSAILSTPVQFREKLEAILLVGLTGPPQDDQVDFISHASSQLAIAVANARAYLAAERLAHELERRNVALLQQRDQLQEVNRLKSEFVANISHELRTPLNAIIGYAELLGDEIYGEVNSEQSQSLDGITESATNLQILIDQILDLSKLEAGKMSISLQEVELNTLIQEVVDFTAPLVKDRSYVVTAHLFPRPLTVTTDPGKVRQILINLLGNAIKFTAEGGVTVAIQSNQGGDVQIKVRDTGIGIRSEYLEVIFDEFRQVDGSSTRMHGGSGLGLAISKKFAHLLGGDIQAASTYGKGSCFTLLLPRAQKIEDCPSPGVTPGVEPIVLQAAAMGVSDVSKS